MQRALHDYSWREVRQPWQSLENVCGYGSK